MKVVVWILFFVVLFLVVLGLNLSMGERASSRYRSTSPVRRTDRVFDCGERWVRVDGRVCELMYVSCYCTAREEEFWVVYWGMKCGLNFVGDLEWTGVRPGKLSFV